jgi:general secretion pathway protein A
VYTESFGLRARPFRATPDPRLFYENAAYREAHATLVYGVRECKGFIVLTGEIGTGKTTLLRRLMDELQGTVRFVFFYNTTVTFDEMVELVCAELELPVAALSRVQRVQRLNDCLLEEARRGGRVVLLIDEAQHLAPEVLENLRLISNLETSSDKLLQIVLAGQPELEARLAEPALRPVVQRIALRYHLTPLAATEIEPFIAYRLRQCGRPRQDLFTAGAIARIAAHSRGIPRVINILCDAALLVAYATDARRVSRRTIDEVAADLRFRTRAAPAGRSGRAARRDGAPASRPGWAAVSLAALTGAVAAAGTLAAGSAGRTALGDVPGTLHAWLAAHPIVQAAGAGPTAASPSPRLASPPGPPPRPFTPVSDLRGDGWPVIVPEGRSVSELVAERYGADRALALDLVRELNPHIVDLDRSVGGERVWMPALTLRTLARRQANDAYDLIVTSHATPGPANRLAERMRHYGYSARVDARDIAPHRQVYRVLIENLDSVDAVIRAHRALPTSG